ncbi:DNA-directed RNA polymerase subunit RpoH/Rpb5 C-terminal domain-containing protein [Nanoarchaeota archaeon]
MAKKIDVTKHISVPKHKKVSEREKKELLEKHSSFKTFPRINVKDPAIQHLDVSEGDIIKIERPSLTAGRTTYYRRVSNA